MEILQMKMLNTFLEVVSTLTRTSLAFLFLDLFSGFSVKSITSCWDLDLDSEWSSMWDDLTGSTRFWPPSLVCSSLPDAAAIMFNITSSLSWPVNGVVPSFLPLGLVLVGVPPLDPLAGDPGHNADTDADLDDFLLSFSLSFSCGFRRWGFSIEFPDGDPGQLP